MLLKPDGHGDNITALLYIYILVLQRENYRMCSYLLKQRIFREASRFVVVHLKGQSQRVDSFVNRTLLVFIIKIRAKCKVQSDYIDEHNELF